MFKGPALQQTVPSPAIAPSQEMVEAELLDTQPVEAVDRFDLEEQVEEDRFNVEPMPTDTTAELLGRAKPRRPRSRVAAAAPVARVCRERRPEEATARAQPRGRKAGRIPVPWRGKA